MVSPDLTSILARLASAGVELVLVGGLAAVAQGAPLMTRDVDIVHARTEVNVERLVACLTTMNARYRGRAPDQVLRPEVQALRGPGHHLLMTDLGPLDVLGAIEEGRTFDELVPESLEVPIGGAIVRVLDLATIVRLKRASTHPKDRLMLPMLEATLAARQRPASS